MSDRQRLTLEYEVEIPPQPVAGQDFDLGTRATMRLTGSVDPAAAVQAFDPQKSLPPRDLAHKIKENLRGWLKYAATQALQQLLSRPGADPIEPVLNASEAQSMMRKSLESTFGAWTFQIEELHVDFEVSDSCVALLPQPLRRRLTSEEGEADTAAAFGPFTCVSQQELDPFADPLTSTQVRVAAWARAIFTAHPEWCGQALDPQGEMSTEQLGDALTVAVGPWIDYAVKQACYNALFEDGRQDPAVLTNEQNMRHRISELCREHLESLGVLHTDFHLNFEAMDQATSQALSLNLRGMTETIAADGSEPDPGQASAEGNARPSIEEAVWRHQKSVMKSQPRIPKKELAKQILQALEQDGYSAEERQRVGRLLGADPSDLP